MPEPVLVEWNNTAFYMMLPKRRGKGYLRTPYWHSLDRRMEDIMQRIQDRGQGYYDMFGNELAYILILDGVPYRDRKSNSHTEMLHTIGEEFAKAFNTDWQECNDVLDRSIEMTRISQ